MRFLQYEPQFLDWLIIYANDRLIYDIGCGEGFLTTDLLDKGANAVGMDIREVVLMENRIKYPNRFLCGPNIGDCLTSKLLQLGGKSVYVLGRPCHGQWIEKLIKRVSGPVIYISRRSYLEEDLEGFKPTELTVPGILPAIDGEEIGVWEVWNS